MHTTITRWLTRLGVLLSLGLVIAACIPWTSMPISTPAAELAMSARKVTLSQWSVGGLGGCLLVLQLMMLSVPFKQYARVATFFSAAVIFLLVSARIPEESHLVGLTYGPGMILAGVAALGLLASNIYIQQKVIKS